MYCKKACCDFKLGITIMIFYYDIADLEKQCRPCLMYEKHRCRSRQFLWVQKIFAQISPNLPKCCLPTFADRFLVWPPKSGLHLFFCKCWAPFLPRFSEILPRYLGVLSVFSGILPRISRILPKCLGILPKFPTNQNFWGCACTPCTPPPTPQMKNIQFEFQ